MLETAATHGLFEATRRSLQAVPNELPAVWLYDARGSRLYDEITRLPDYYLPRREAEILQARSSLISERTRARTLVELGSGSAPNTRLLLDELSGTLERYIPFDVSEHALHDSAGAIAATYPAISVEPIVGDFERDLGALPGGGPRLVAFLGSTIGNLYPAQRGAFLSALAHELGDDDALLLGVDLVKDVGRLEAAYHDSPGVTEAFVRNALRAANRELDATFEQGRFDYDPLWDPVNEWMDVGLRARESHVVSVRHLGLELEFAEGERLRVEISSKFRREAFGLELERAGLSPESWWTDAAGDFAVVLARPRIQLHATEGDDMSESPLCSHLDQIEVTELPETIEGCEECLKIGSGWVHLRMCMTCGKIGCCDSSPNRHATAHAGESGDPIIRSAEPGEDWSWCYLDEVAFATAPH